MLSVGLLARLGAKPGKEADLEAFLKGGLALAEQAPDTRVWFALRLGPSTFGILDAFDDELGWQAHLSGQIVAALTEKADELLAAAPTTEQVDVLATKLPEIRS